MVPRRVIALMHLVPLFEGTLRYTGLQMVSYEGGKQAYGTLEGSIWGDRLAGTLQLTNLAIQRSDNVNCPKLGACSSWRTRPSSTSK